MNSFLELADPSKSWWALLAIPVIIMFILKVRLRRREISTLLFWDQLLQDQPPRAWWRRLRNLVALLLQLAFLALLVGALVDPLWSWQRRGARQIVYVIDNSSSMSATDDGAATRLQRAVKSAHRMVGSLRQHDTAAIVTAGGAPRVAVGATGDVRILREAIDEIEAADQPTRLADAVELARRLIADDEKREVIVLTDGADDATAELADAADVTLYGFAGETPNVGITAFQVRRSFADATSFQVLVEVTNFGDETTECRLEIDLDGSLVDVVPLTLEPSEPWRRTLDHTATGGGTLTATLDVDDALAADDQAIAVLPRRDPIPVLLVSPGSLFLRSVFTSIPGVELSIAEQLPDEIPRQTIVVIHKTKIDAIPADRNCVIVDPVADSDLWKLGEPIAQPIVTDQAADSPLMAHIRLQNVILGGARQLEFSSEVEPLLEDPDESAMYARIPRSGGDVLVLTVNLDDGDLPLRIAFPVMIKNAIESFLGDKGELRPSIAAGQSTTIDLGSQSSLTANGAADMADESAEATDENEPSSEWVLRSPDGKISQASVVDRQLQVGPFEQIGLWQVGPASVMSPPTSEDADRSAVEAEVISIAVNQANPAESDLRPRASLPPPPQPSIVWGGYSLWFYLSLLATVGITVEWFLYQRRIIG
jgi:hypothetical protein